jgi:hypothetical protein
MLSGEVVVVVCEDGVRSLQVMKSKLLIVADLGLVKAYKPEDS